MVRPGIVGARVGGPFVDPSPDPLEPRRQRHARDRHHRHDATHLCGDGLCAKLLRGAVRPSWVFSWSHAGRQFHGARSTGTGEPSLPAGVDCARLSAAGRPLPPQGSAGTILVDTAARYVYYVLPEGKAIRYGAIVGEDAQAWSGVATVGRKEEWPGWTPTANEKRRLGPLPNYVE